MTDETRKNEKPKNQMRSRDNNMNQNGKGIYNQGRFRFFKSDFQELEGKVKYKCVFSSERASEGKWRRNDLSYWGINHLGIK